MTTRLVVDLYHSLVLLTHEGKHVQNQSRGKHSFIFKSPRGPGSRLQSPKKFVRPFGPQFGLKIGGGGPPLDPPLISKFQKASHNNNNLPSINIKNIVLHLPSFSRISSGVGVQKLSKVHTQLYVVYVCISLLQLSTFLQMLIIIYFFYRY